MADISHSAGVDETLLSALLDRLIPAVDNLLPAGQMGIAPEVIRLAGQQDRFWGLFSDAVESFASKNPSFIALGGAEQDMAIRSFETDNPVHFGVLLDISYIVYYKEPAVHERIGWESRPPQPDGNVMTPWDESVLEKTRKRAPFWRKV